MSGNEEAPEGATRSFPSPPPRRRPRQSKLEAVETKAKLLPEEDEYESSLAASEPEQEPRESEPLLPQGEARKRGSDLYSLHGKGGLAFGFMDWFGMLQLEYGRKLLLLLFASQHLLKGIVQQFQASAVMWLFREYHVSGPQMQIFLSVTMSAWALKPVIGVVSDIFPILGYRKAPYVIASSLVGVACTSAIGFSSSESMGVISIVLCLYGMSMQASTCDLLTEAKYSESLHARPKHGPDLITYVWGGVSVGNMIAISCVGWILIHLGPRAVFLACVAPSAAILYPTFMNYFEETPLSKAAVTQLRAKFAEQREVLSLCGLMTVMTFGVTVVGVASNSHRVHFWSAVATLLILLPAFHLVLRKEIANTNVFFMLQAALSLNIGGATFYFYTDQPDQYAGGPHFSAWFFSSTLGLAASFMSIFGLATYSTWMKSWSYRSLILFSNIMVTCLSLLDAAMFLRLNVKLGIPDSVFVLGSSISSVVIKQWQWMPGVVMMSQLCPVGMEATLFALLAGCCNIGYVIADFLGSYMLEYLKVKPTGTLDEGHQFDNLWKASIVATCMPAVTILLVPFLIPDAKQTDALLVNDPDSATAGSPLSRWLGQRRTGGGGDGHV